MSLIYSGKKRSLTFTIFRNGIELDDSPFDGRQAFVFNNVTYNSWSNTDLGQKSYSEYSARLLAFESYLESLYPGLDFTTDFDSPNYDPYVNDALCVTPATTTTTTTLAPTTTTTTTQFVVDPPSVAVMMSINSDAPSSYSITQISFKGTNTLVVPIVGTTILTQYPLVPWLIDSGTIVISILGSSPTIGGYIRIIDSNGVGYTQNYTGPGDYTFSYPAIVIDSLTQVILELNISNVRSTTTTTTATPTTTTTTTGGPTTTTTTEEGYTTTTTTAPPTTTTTTTETPTTTTTTEPVIYYNDTEYSGYFNKTCTAPQIGTSVLYTVGVGTVWSYVSVEQANLTAYNMVQQGGQANADADPTAYCYYPDPPDPCEGMVLTAGLTISRMSLSTVEVTVTPHITSGTPTYQVITVVVQNGGYWDNIYRENHLFTNGVPITISVSGLDNSHVYLAEAGGTYINGGECTGGYASASIHNYY